MNSTADALKIALRANPTPPSVQVSIDTSTSGEGHTMSLVYLRDGLTEHVLEGVLPDVDHDRARVETWASALAGVLHRSRDDFFAPLETLPALLSRRELVSEGDFVRAMLDSRYCERALEASQNEYDGFDSVRFGNDLALRDVLDREPAGLGATDEQRDGLLATCVGTPPDEHGPGDVVAVFHLLLERGADVGARGREGTTALHVALPWAVAPLVAAGARFDLEDDAGLTPLARAREEGNEELVEALLSSGAEA